MRDAAVSLFAEHGPESVTIRQIAARAEVSPALVVHHFGSKAGLRDAVDAHVSQLMEDLLDQMDAPEVMESLAQGDVRSFAEVVAVTFPPDSPVPDYLRRMFLSGEPIGKSIFNRWFRITRSMLEGMVSAGTAASSDDPDVRSAFLLVNDLAVLVLRGPLTEALGFDPLSASGVTRWTNEIAAAYRNGIFTEGEQQ